MEESFHEIVQDGKAQSNSCKTVNKDYELWNHWKKNTTITYSKTYEAVKKIK